MADILSHKGNARTVPILETKNAVALNESRFSPVYRQFFQTAEWITSPPGAMQPYRIVIGGNDDEADARKAGFDSFVPQDGQGIRFLPAAAAGTPDPEPGMSTGTSLFRKGWDDCLFQAGKYTPVPIKARDSDVAQGIELDPFPRMGCQKELVGGNVSQPEVPQTSVNAFTNLPAYPTKSRPAKVQLRQSPLQKVDAFLVLHRNRVDC